MDAYKVEAYNYAVQATAVPETETDNAWLLRRFTDAELLGELHKRKRLVVVTSTERVPQECHSRYGSEQSFKDSVERRLSRNLSDAFTREEKLVEYTSEGLRACGQFDVLHRMATWAITQPKHRGRIE